MKPAACAFLLVLTLAQLQSTASDQLAELVRELPFKMAVPKLPSIPSRTISITEYGAVGDGQSLNTTAFATAISACARAGGGHIIVPAGLWLTGPIQLSHRIDLHLESGALILFSRNLDLYVVTNATTGKRQVISPISASGLHDISITGPGVIDGSGDAWRPVKKEKLTASQWKALLDSGGSLNPAGTIWTPAKSELLPGSPDAVRPRMVQLEACERVLLDGPTFQNSPNWNLHPLLCEDLVLRNITVLNPWFAQNGDGLDIDACRRVLLYNARFDVGDDAICLKSGIGEAAWKRGRASEEIVIRNCVVYHAHGGITIGSEMSGGIRNVYADNCIFLGTDIGLRFKSARGRGGVVENLWFNRITMRNIPTDAIGFTMNYGGKAPEDASENDSADAASVPAVNEGTPRFRNLHFNHIVCNGARRAVYLTGLPEMPLENLDFDNLAMSALRGFETANIRGVTVSNANILPQSGPAFMFNQSQDVTLDRVAGPTGTAPLLKLQGAKTDRVRLRETETSPAARPVELAPEVKSTAFTLENTAQLPRTR
jgi:polygalacturonase